MIDGYSLSEAVELALREELREQNGEEPAAETEKKELSEEELYGYEIGSEAHKLAIEDKCYEIAKWMKVLVKSARKNQQNVEYLMMALKNRLYDFATKDMPRIGMPSPARANLRMEAGIIEKWRFELAAKFFFDSIKGPTGAGVSGALREQFAVQAVARADALLDALGYDVDLELDLP